MQNRRPLPLDLYLSESNFSCIYLFYVFTTPNGWGRGQPLLPPRLEVIQANLE